MKESKTNGVPERTELPVDKTWDLSKLYANVDEWEKDFNMISTLLEEFCSFKGKLAESPVKLAEAFIKQDELERLMENVYVFTHLRADQDLADSENQTRYQRANAKLAEVQGETAWFEPEILAMPEKTLLEFIKSKELAFYQRSLKELLRAKPHTLSAPEERILGMASDVFSDAHHIFSVLNDADMRFPTIPDGKGGETELTHGNYTKLLENPQRKIRQSAFNAMFDTYKKFKNTIAAIFNTNVKTNVLNAKLRNFSSALAASLHPANIDESIYNNLISTINNNLDILHRYFALRGKVLKLDKIDMFDILNPLIPECKNDIEWDQACEWVREAIKPMGEDYQKVSERAYSERWIDVLECRGKHSGAYSSGSYDSNPHILLNYNGTLKYVFALAHELGHSMHTYYSNTNQEYHYAEYRTFVAEIASTTNEILLHEYLMKTSDNRNFRMNLLALLIEGFRGTVFRQVMFAEFEKSVHALVAEGTPLTADLLSEKFYELNKKYHGAAVEPDRRIAYEWARIPHFYYNFYVYKYAIGFSAAITLSQKILKEGDDALNAYLGFLKAGNSKDVLDIMKDAGIDLSSPAPIECALKEFDKTVKELEQELSQ